MYKILTLNDLEQIKYAYEKYKLNFYEPAIIEKTNKKFLFGKFNNNKLDEIIFVNERENGLNIFLKISDNFDLEKAVDFFANLHGNIYLMDINKKQRDVFENRGFTEKDKLIKYELETYDANSDIALNTVTEDDLEELALIDEKAFGEFWKQDKIRMLPAIKNERIYFLKYVENKRIIAYTIFGDNHIMRLAVLPEHQSRGIGKKIMLYTINFLNKKSVKKVTLTTQITNSKSRPLYENLGFKERALTYVMEKF